MVTVKYAEFLDAFEFVSSGAPFEHSAYICADTGAIYWASSMIDLEEKVPNNLETSDRYIAVPHKNDLNLGRNLALFFVEQELPDDYNTVAGFFRNRGAYSRFKDLLESRGVLEKWYMVEASAMETALRDGAKRTAFHSAMINEPSNLLVNRTPMVQILDCGVRPLPGGNTRACHGAALYDE